MTIMLLSRENKLIKLQLHYVSLQQIAFCYTLIHLIGSVSAQLKAYADSFQFK